MAFSGTGSSSRARASVAGARNGMRTRESEELEAETRRMEARLRALKEERERLMSKIAAPVPSTWISSSGPLRSTGKSVIGGGGMQTPSPRGGAPAARSSAPTQAMPASESARTHTHTGVSAGGAFIPSDMSTSGAVGGDSGRHQRPSLSMAGAAAVQSGPTPSSAAAATTRPSTAGRRNLVQSQAVDWSVGQVNDWLRVLGLDRYGAVFAEHEISGGVLLDMTPDDLDYMGVRALGHRKMILKGVDQLRVACGLPALTLSSPSRAPAAASPSDDAAQARNASRLDESVDRDAHETSVAAEARPRPKQEPKQMVHWSQVPAMPAHTETSTQSTAGGDTSLLDGQFDEAAEQAAFKEAVMAWRRGQAKSTPAPSAAAGAASGVSDTWTNPFDTMSSADGAQPDGAQHGSLLEGAYDEAAERAKFQEAVAAWRSGSGRPAGNVDGGTVTDTQAGSAKDAQHEAQAACLERIACYQCYKVFAADHGWRPADASNGAVHAAEDDARNRQRTAVFAKPFCSRSCFDAAMAAVDAAFAVVAAAKSSVAEAADAATVVQTQDARALAQPSDSAPDDDRSKAPTRASDDGYDQDFDDDEAAPTHENVAGAPFDADALLAAAADAAAALLATRANAPSTTAREPDAVEPEGSSEEPSGQPTDASHDTVDARPALGQAQEHQPDTAPAGLPSGVLANHGEEATHDASEGAETDERAITDNLRQPTLPVADGALPGSDVEQRLDTLRAPTGASADDPHGEAGSDAAAHARESHDVDDSAAADRDLLARLEVHPSTNNGDGYDDEFDGDDGGADEGLPPADVNAAAASEAITSMKETTGVNDHERFDEGVTAAATNAEDEGDEGFADSLEQPEMGGAEGVALAALANSADAELPTGEEGVQPREEERPSEDELQPREDELQPGEDELQPREDELPTGEDELQRGEDELQPGEDELPTCEDGVQPREDELQPREGGRQQDADEGSSHEPEVNADATANTQEADGPRPSYTPPETDSESKQATEDAIEF